MNTINNLNEFIYNNDNDIAFTLAGSTMFEGSNFNITNMFSYFEIWVLESHHCQLRTKTSEFNLIQGDILIFSENDDTSVVYSDTNAIFLKLQIDTDAYLKLLPLSASVNISNIFARHSKKFSNKIPVTHPASRAIRDSFFNMARIFDIKQNGYEIEVLGETIKVLLTIIRNTEYINTVKTDEHVKITNKSNLSLKRAIDYIDLHITDDLTLDRLSEIADLSPNYLSNIFREHTGVRLWDYISEKRIRLATQLLVKNPNDSIISIALKCGFNNCPNFNRAFKKYTGQTPMKYKNLILRQED